MFGVNLFGNGTSDVVEHRRVLEIQDGSQITGSTNISEIMTYTINIPSANLWFLTIVKSREVYQSVSKYERQWQPKTEVLISLEL